MVIVDTSVWADMLNGHPSQEALALRELIERDQEIFLTGIIVQEILQGIKEKKKRTEIRQDLELYTFISPSLLTHINAAELFCSCRQKGVTVRKSIDCLIACLAMEYDLAVLHKDRDFTAISKTCPLKLYSH